MADEREKFNLGEALLQHHDKKEKAQRSANKVKEDARNSKKTIAEPGSGKRIPQATRLLALCRHLELYRDPSSDGYVVIDGEPAKIRSALFKRFLYKRLYDSEGIAANSDAMNQAINVMEARAVFDGKLIELHNRVALLEGAIWYDLGAGRAVKITERKWEIITRDVPLLFKRYPHQLPQVTPEPGGNLSDFLRIVNVSEDHHNIVTVTIAADFIPAIPHPVVDLCGGQGGGKTTFMEFRKLLVDPSQVVTLNMPTDKAELIQQLDHHYVVPFDNVSGLTDWQSDVLCTAATGGAFSKRKLYTDDEDHICSFLRCVTLNGINVVSTRPDLLDRSILIHMERIAKKNRKLIKALRHEYRAMLPGLLGAALTAVSKAMSLYPAIHLTEPPRMADFATWGVAIAAALGIGETRFLSDYNKNISLQAGEILLTNSLVQAVMRLMTTLERWQGNVTEAYAALLEMSYPAEKKPPRDDRSFPSAPNKLRNALKRLESTLFDLGVSFTIREGSGDKGGSVIIIFQKVENLSDLSDRPLDQNEINNFSQSDNDDVSDHLSDHDRSQSDKKSDHKPSKRLSDRLSDREKNKKNNVMSDQSDQSDKFATLRGDVLDLTNIEIKELSS